MTHFKKSLRALIAAGSVAGFLGAWALLGHAGQPVQIQSPPAVVTPAPFLSTLPGNRPPTNLQPLPSLPRSGLAVRPRLRTGGS
jgi:hypothetical protein